MLIFAGLGNPGPKHAKQRHNIGFMAADEIIRRYGLSLRQSRHHSYVAEGNIAGEKILLLKPKNFMNESGRALGSAVRYYKTRPGAVTIFYDELDLTPGKVRVKLGGGAGHNGIRAFRPTSGKTSVVSELALDIPVTKSRRMATYCPVFWSGANLGAKTIDAIAEALPILIDGDNVGFMTRSLVWRHLSH